MARKRPAPPPRVPTADQVSAAVRQGKHDVAVETAQRLVAFDPKPKHQQLLRDTLLKAWGHYLDAGDVRMQFHLMDVGQKLGCTDPEWVRAFAVLLAKSGQRELAAHVSAPLNDPAFAAKLTAHYADWLMRHTEPKAVPEEWLPAFDAVLKGFLHLRAANDDAAREALNAVGLSSPFLEWKVLLRGLLAFAANDDPRALENFTRLAPDRLPFRLAAPFRAKVDPAFGPRTGGVTLGERFGGGGLIGKLRAVQTAMAGKKTLKAAFKAAEAVVPQLRKELPAAVPKLANCFYHAIIRQGEQDDLTRFRKLFGSPADDPQFYRLEALVFEQIEQLDMALQRWAAYEGWLSEPRAGWPQPLADRCRAVILNRMAGIAADVEEGGDDDPFDDFDGFFAAPSRKKKKAKPTDPAVYLRKAVALAPDWEPPVRELFARAVQNDDLAEAEAVAAKYLDRNPQSLFMLASLSTLHIRSGRADSGLELRRRMLAVNPLDKLNRHHMACAHLAHARRLGVNGKAKDALAALADGRELCLEEVPTSYHALKAVLHRKLGDKEQAEADAGLALAQHGARLTARLYLHANAVLCKLKPADKTAAGKEYTAALAEPPHPKEVNMLLAGWDLFHHEGLTYTGQKTQEKKIYDAMVRAADGDGPEIEFEGLVVLLNNRKQYALVKKLAPKLGRRFPKNPVFPLALAEAELGKSARSYGYKLTEPLRKAKVLAEASGEERHRQLLPKIEELLKVANPFGALMGAFGGFFGDE